MKLSTRISLFFLAALAVVLIGFSGSIYWFVASHLMHELDARQSGVLNTLNAAVEIDPDGLEWEVTDRRLAIASPDAVEPLEWTVFDNVGHRLDGSQGPNNQLLTGTTPADTQWPDAEDVSWKGAQWRISRLSVLANDQNRASSDGSIQGDEPATKRYPKLVLAVGTSMGHMASQLRILGATLAGLTAAIWLSAALLGNWFCCKALAPLTRMAGAIGMISAADLSQRVLAPTTGDELERLSVAFNELLSRLEVSFERQRRFAAEASHQLRTPLTAMLGQVDVALRRDRTTVEYHRTVVSVQEQATRLRQIIETLLFLSREDAESSPPESERIELNGWLCEHLTTWKLHPRHDDLRLEADASQPLWVSVHAGLLGQAVDNLLDNACKYSKPGSTIRARTAHTESTALLAVEDCGYGIPEEDVAYVLEPFFRSTDARRRGVDGAGLGLSLVNRIASTLGGQVVVQSIIGRGSVFTLSFPSAAELQRSSTKAAETSLREIETQSCETVHP